MGPEADGTEGLPESLEGFEEALEEEGLLEEMPEEGPPEGVEEVASPDFPPEEYLPEPEEYLAEAELPENDEAGEFLGGRLEGADAPESQDEEVELGWENDEGELELGAEGPDDGADGSEAQGQEVEVQEHLKDAIEGSLRLKRLLSREDETAKRRKTDEALTKDRPIHQAKVRQLLNKWMMPVDATCMHVLEQCSLEELQYVHETNYWPKLPFETKKTPGELLGAHVIGMTEKRLGGGTRLDVVSAFRVRWGLSAQEDAMLRALPHKDLRHALACHDGTCALEETVAMAAVEREQEEEEEEEEETAQTAAPSRPGVKTLGRFSRLELIDPLADCAVFGDANLTFSLNLARHRKQFGHVGRVIATTFEEVDTLRERYTEIDESIKTLEEHHAEVYHGIDCTRIAIDPRFEGMEGRLGAVYYNFPHSGAVPGFFDSNPMVNWRHENLMRLFFRALRPFMKPGGLVKVASNSGAVGVRYSYIVGGALDSEFVHVETMPFMEWHLHRYGRSYGDRRDLHKRPDARNNQSYNSQSAHADMVYCFCYEPSGKELPKPQPRLPPSVRTLAQCCDGPFAKLMPGPAKERLARELHARFVKEVSGEHVG